MHSDYFNDSNLRESHFDSPDFDYMPFDDESHFLDPVSPVKMWRPDLPHWEQTRRIQFITFRLKDSLPEYVIANLNTHKKHFLHNHPKPGDNKTLGEYTRLFSRTTEELLHAGHGSCLLADSELRAIVAEALEYFHDREYCLGAYVVMPNHVHLVAYSFGEKSVLHIVERVKRFSARKIHKITGGKGELWSRSYDRMIRNSIHLDTTVGYIRNNPVGLPAGTYTLGGILINK